jgi:hypothetical protein
MSAVFFSFITLDDAGPEDHRAYNRWHQLDHRPENLALDGVRWGDRWARTTSLREASQAADEHAATDYVAMYWFRPPLVESLAEWDALGEASFQWGRGPMLPGVRRTLLAFFTPVKGYSAPHALVSADVLPFRPHRGVHLTVTRFADAHGDDTHEHHRWEDRVLAPALLATEGVAGLWTFSFRAYQQHSTLALGTDRPDGPGSLRARLVYFEDDPATTTARLHHSVAGLEQEGGGAPSTRAETVFSSALATIVPWQDW